MNLYKWTHNMRTAYRAGCLSPEEIELLEALPEWEWEVQNSAWNNRYEILVKFLNENDRYPTASELRWVDSQRMAYKNRKLSKERIELLEALPEWEWEPKGSVWDRHFQILVSFLEENGRYPIRRESNWVDTQRISYRKGRLSKERIELLESLPGWEWELFNSAWDKHFQILLKFLEKNGRHPTQHELWWVSDQRQNYKNGKLSRERIELLEAIPDWEWVGDIARRIR